MLLFLIFFIPTIHFFIQEHYEVVELEYPFQKFKLRFVKWAQKKLESVSSPMNEASHRDQEVSFKQVKKR
jgi:hypothetical protein